MERATILVLLGLTARGARMCIVSVLLAFGVLFAVRPASAERAKCEPGDVVHRVQVGETSEMLFRKYDPSGERGLSDKVLAGAVNASNQTKNEQDLIYVLKLPRGVPEQTFVRGKLGKYAWSDRHAREEWKGVALVAGTELCIPAVVPHPLPEFQLDEPVAIAPRGPVFSPDVSVPELIANLKFREELRANNWFPVGELPLPVVMTTPLDTDEDVVVLLCAITFGLSTLILFIQSVKKGSETEKVISQKERRVSSLEYEIRQFIFGRDTLSKMVANREHGITVRERVLQAREKDVKDFTEDLRRFAVEHGLPPEDVAALKTHPEILARLRNFHTQIAGRLRELRPGLPAFDPSKGHPFLSLLVDGLNEDVQEKERLRTQNERLREMLREAKIDSVGLDMIVERAREENVQLQIRCAEYAKRIAILEIARRRSVRPHLSVVSVSPSGALKVERGGEFDFVWSRFIDALEYLVEEADAEKIRRAYADDERAKRVIRSFGQNFARTPSSPVLTSLACKGPADAYVPQVSKHYPTVAPLHKQGRFFISSDTLDLPGFLW